MMLKDVILIAQIVVLFIVRDVTDAELLRNSRILADGLPKQDVNVTVPPDSSPVVENDNGKDKSPKEEQVKNITPPTIPPPTIPPPTIPPPTIPPPTIPSPVIPPPSDTNNDNNTSTEKLKDDDKNPKEEVKEKEKEEKKPKESCDGVKRRCQDENLMVACIKSFDDVSKAFLLLIQNKGANSLNVDLTFPSSGDKQDAIEKVNIPLAKVKGNGVTKANVPLTKVEGNEIKLSSGNGYCILHIDQGAPTFQGNFYQWSASYSKFVTPTYGAYLILVITFLAGGVCLCCWLCKRKKTNEVPYQELEMSVPASAADVDNADGWDEVWDDDWDEEKAVKSPGHSISANGLTTRTPKKDGWEDWDD